MLLLGGDQEYVGHPVLLAFRRLQLAEGKSHAKKNARRHIERMVSMSFPIILFYNADWRTHSYSSSHSSSAAGLHVILLSVLRASPRYDAIDAVMNNEIEEESKCVKENGEQKRMVVLSMCEDRGMVELIHRKVYLFGKEDLGEMSITDSVSVLAFGLVLGFGIVLYEEWKTERKRRLL